ncbi:MAG: bifunctional nuclease family protein [Acidilobaceae archaeon]
MSGRNVDNVVRVVDVYVSQRLVRDMQRGFSWYLVELNLALEDGRLFTMVNIPSDVAEALAVYRGSLTPPRRQSIYTFLLSSESFKEALARGLKRVVIDELDPITGLYTASVEFEDEGVSMTIKMIPSHAVYLALLTGKSIYVKKELVDQQEKFGEYEEER